MTLARHANQVNEFEIGREIAAIDSSKCLKLTVAAA